MVDDTNKILEAEKFLNILLAENPNDARALRLLSKIECEKRNFERACVLLKKSVEINPRKYIIYKELANIYYLNINNPDATIDYYKQYLEILPIDEDAKGCLGLAYLKTKDYEKGWELFEYRHHRKDAISERELDFEKIWKGEDIKNKTIYVYYEAGFGDTIMFARYLPLLKEKCAKVIFGSQPSLVDLFSENFPKVEIIDEDKTDEQLEFNVHAPLMSLPYLLKLNTEKEVALTDKYLKPNPHKVQSYKEKYFKNNKFKIGIKWHGKKTQSPQREIELKKFFKLFDIKDIKFYSIQKGEGIEQLEFAKDYDIENLGQTFESFSDTAAAIENLDLVICNDTSVAHLAGAMGKPCWILLPFVQDWRWSTDLSYCYWYKSVKIFHQKKAGEWDNLFDEVYNELQKKITKFSPKQ